MFACTVPGPPEYSQAKNMVDAAKATGIRFFVWSALEPISKLTNGKYKAQFFDDKAAICDYLKEVGVPHANVFLGFFMESA